MTFQPVATYLGLNLLEHSKDMARGTKFYGLVSERASKAEFKPQSNWGIRKILENGETRQGTNY